MRKSLIPVTVATVLGVGSLFGGFSVYSEAASISSLKSQKNQIEDKKSDIESTIDDANKKIENIEGQQANVRQDMKRIDLAIGDTNTKIREKNAKITDTKAEITKLQADIKVIEERIQKRNELLKDRARNFQENGGVVNYLDVLMGSSSFSDFIDRANAVATIMEADQGILKQAEADKIELDQKQAEVQKSLASLQKMLSDLKAMQGQLNAQNAEKGKLLGSLEAQAQKIQEDKMSMEEQAKVYAAQASAIQKAIKVEQERQAELQRQQQAAPSGGGSGSTPFISSGNFTRPASGFISSTYGARWGEFHYGVDIANRGANVPILAAATGVVAVSHYSDSYGNVVYLTHSINGKIYTTVYAHMQVRMVSEGQVVTKGQQIGIMGSTGESTGQHLHFELYNGAWAYHSAINPMGIIPF
ncbi:MAG TPA: peptidoglycan DD-metalloendopeptidase family protein [Bacillales bacterium]|nr:peptidoglycan DD-metalloendopeptidase family protein [Bacillales bacterium]